MNINSEDNEKTDFRRLVIPTPEILNFKFQILNPLIEKILRLDQINKIYQSCQLRNPTPDVFCRAVLRELKVEFSINEEDIDRLKKISGPILFVANHPYGAIEALFLILFMSAVRDDYKLIGNFLLAQVKAFNSILIPVDPFNQNHSKRNNLKPLLQTIRYLKQGNLVGIFPSGQVSTIKAPNKNEAEDINWTNHLGAIAHSTKATVVPIYFFGQNSMLFQQLSLISPIFRTALLPREMLKSKKKLEYTIGASIPYEKMRIYKTSQELTAYLQSRTYLMRYAASSHSTSDPLIKLSKESKVVPIAPLMDPVLLQGAILALHQDGKHLLSQDQFDLFLFKADESPSILLEIGALREITFRKAGEGTGKTRDLDSYDRYYHHLVLWDRDQSKVVGSYRLCFVEEIFKKFGLRGLYTHSLFKMDPQFIVDHLASIELGRSFIRQEYQKEFWPLPLLWMGIAKLIAEQKKVRYLFGSVSISAQFKPVTQTILVQFLKENKLDKSLEKKIKPRNQFKNLDSIAFPTKSLNCAKTLIQELIDSDFQVPPLLKHYFKLGGSALGFNVDSKFGNSVDCLFILDITKAHRPTLEKYMTSEAYQDYLKYHEEKNKVVPESS